MQHWLLKSEPLCFSIYDLQKVGRMHWDGVRNYQARNYLRDCMQEGDICIFYHSNAAPSGAAGVCTVVKSGYPDHTAWESTSDHFDPNASPDHPRWFMVDVAFVCIFDTFVPLSDIKKNPFLSHLPLVQKGNRLSVMPIDPFSFQEICQMGKSRIL